MSPHIPCHITIHSRYYSNNFKSESFRVLTYFLVYIWIDSTISVFDIIWKFSGDVYDILQSELYLFNSISSMNIIGHRSGFCSERLKGTKSSRKERVTCWEDVSQNIVINIIINLKLPIPILLSIKFFGDLLNS